MEYTIQRLARLAGVSTRTLRYYDQIGLLTPERINSSGYRIYGREQVDALQQILFYRELDMELGEIQKLLKAPGYDRKSALKAHMAALTQKRARLDALIDTVRHTIQADEEGIEMSDQQKFEGFKKQLINENERKYGDEAREKYGEEAVEQGNRKMMNLSQEQYDDMQRVSGELHQGLEAAVTGGASPEGDEGKRLCALHKQWLSFTWPQYTEAAHRGLTQMYIDDERFTAHYDKDVPGCAKFLRDAVHAHTKG